MTRMTDALFDQSAAPRTLAECEAVIERGRQTFVEVGVALLMIHDSRLYREGWRTFEDYCQQRWGWTREHVYRLMQAAEVAQNVISTSQTPLSQSQAIALAPLPAEDQRAIAQDVDFSQTTVRELQELVRERKETKPHALAHEERLVAYESRAASRDALLPEAAPRVWVPPYDRIVRQDALSYLRDLPEGCADVCVTSPPYWMKRTYTDGDPCELGQEPDPADYVDALCAIVNEIGRVLTPEGCLFLNLGDTLASQPGQYRGDPSRRRGISNQAIRANGTAPADRQFDTEAEKTFCLIPESVAMRLVLDFGWRLASKIVWHKIGHAPENVYDRLTQAWEPVYVLTRARHAYFRRNPEGVDGRPTDVWAIPVGRGGDANGHLAPYPDDLVERAVRHSCPPGGTVLDPFAGSGTTLRAVQRLGRRFLGCDLLAPHAIDIAVV